MSKICKTFFIKYTYSPKYVALLLRNSAVACFSILRLVKKIISEFYIMVKKKIYFQDYLAKKNIIYGEQSKQQQNRG